MERSEWLQARRLGIGASDSPAILGKSRWASALHVYLEKTGEMPPAPATPEQIAGLELEPYVAQIYSRVCGRDVSRFDRVIHQHMDLEWMLCSPDFYIKRPEGVSDELLECKTSQTHDGWGDEGTCQVPEGYYVQAQHQMFVTGFRRVVFALLVRGVEFSTYVVDYDEAFCKGMVDILRTFWHDHVLARNPPAPDWSHPKTPELMATLAKARGVAAGPPVSVKDDDLLEALLEHERCKAVIKEATEDKERAYADILSKVAPNQTTVVNNRFKVSLAKVQRKGYTVEAGEYVTMRVKEIASE